MRSDNGFDLPLAGAYTRTLEWSASITGLYSGSVRDSPAEKGGVRRLTSTAPGRASAPEDSG